VRPLLSSPATRRASAGPLSSLPSNVQSDLPALEEAGQEVSQGAAAPKPRRAPARSGRAASSAGRSPAPSAAASDLPRLEEGEDDGMDVDGGAAPAPTPSTGRRGAASGRRGRGAAAPGAPGGGGGDSEGGAPRGSARTPERSQGEAGSAGTGLTPGAAGMRTPMSVPRPEFGRPLGAGRASSFGTVRGAQRPSFWGARDCGRRPVPGAKRSPPSAQCPPKLSIASLLISTPKQ
jgi:hypothetical protein